MNYGASFLFFFLFFLSKIWKFGEPLNFYVVQASSFAQRELNDPPRQARKQKPEGATYNICPWDAGEYYYVLYNRVVIYVVISFWI